MNIRLTWLSKLGVTTALIGLGVVLVQHTGMAQDGSGRQGTVAATRLNVRAKPAQHFERIGQFRKDAIVRIVGETEGWYEVLVPEDARAWVAARLIGNDDRINVNVARVHSGAGVVFSTYCLLSRGEKVEKIDEPQHGWQRIKVPPHATGWISKRYVNAEDVEVMTVAGNKPEKTAETPSAPPKAEAPKPEKTKPVEKPKPEPKPVVVAAKSTPVVVETPKPITVEKPKPVVEEKPKPVVVEMPKPVVVEKPKPAVVEMPAPVVSTPIEKPQTPTPPVVPAAEKEPEVAVRTLPPQEPKPVVEKPKPVVVEKPKPVVVEKPKPVIIEKPKPIAVEVPKTVVIEKPKPVVVEKPKPVVVEKPKPVVAVEVKPEPEKTKAPEKAVTPPPATVPTVAFTEKASDKKPEVVAKTQPKPEPQTVKPLKPEVTSRSAVPEKPEIVKPKVPTKPEPQADPVRIASAVEPSTPSTGDTLDKATRPFVDMRHAPGAQESAPVPDSTAGVQLQEGAPVSADELATLAPSKEKTSELLMKEGIIFSLNHQANSAATHALYLRIGHSAYPVCYLNSKRINLAEWERRMVRVYGREKVYQDWTRPILDVESIQVILRKR